MKTRKKAGVLALAVAAMGLFAATPLQAACRYSKFAALKVDTAQASPHIEGSVNGVPIKVLVDTGAESTVLTRVAAEKAKLPLSHTDATSIGIGGESQEYQATVQEFSVGAAKWGRMRMRVVWDMAGMDEDSEGAILGTAVLFQNDVELLLKDNTIHLFRPQECKDTYLGYWDKDAIVLPMLDNQSADDLRAMVTIEVNGKPLRALLDTGATHSSIDQKVATMLGVTKPAAAAQSTIVGVGAREQSAWVGTFQTVAIGPEEIRNARLTVVDLWSGARKDMGYSASDVLTHAPQMILGADFLTSHRVLFANSQRRVYLTHVGGPVFKAGAKDAPVADKPAAAAKGGG